VDYIIGRYGNETDERIKVQILEMLGQLENASARDYALTDINDSSGINVIAAALVYLAKIGYDDVVFLIDSIGAENDYPYLKVKITEALAEIGGEAVKPRLVTLFNDSSATVRAAAFNALCKFDSVNIDYYIRQAVNDSDYVVVSLAVDKIGQLKKERLLPQLMTFIKMHDLAETDLKRSVVQAAGEFIPGESDSLVEAILYQGLMDYDYLVSQEASRIYMEKLGIDKSSYAAKPYTQVGTGRIKSLIEQYQKNPQALISTNRGDIEIEMYFDVAPLTVYNFISLVQKGFYDNLTFHRVIPNFVIQGGDPRGDGWGGPGYNIRCEYSNLTYDRGAVGMAHSGKDSGGSQFFITHSPQPHLAARYTLFGHVTSGMETVDNIVRGDTIYTVTIIESEEDE
jgi:cyclophilin family peptidyl-prolyl cis-trans isomerase